MLVVRMFVGSVIFICPPALNLFKDYQISRLHMLYLPNRFLKHNFFLIWIIERSIGAMLAIMIRHRNLFAKFRHYPTTSCTTKRIYLPTNLSCQHFLGRTLTEIKLTFRFGNAGKPKRGKLPFLNSFASKVWEI